MLMILKGIYLLNENILKRRLLNGERIILGVKVDNSYKIIEEIPNLSFPISLACLITARAPGTVSISKY